MKFFTVATGKVLKETKSYDKMIEKRNNRKEYKRKLFPCADCQEGGALLWRGDDFHRARIFRRGEESSP